MAQNNDTNAPDKDPKASPDAAPAPEAPKSPENQLTLTTEQLNERLARERRSYLKKLGFESEDSIAALQKEREEMVKQREEEERAKMSEIERIKADFEEEQRSRVSAEERYRALEFESAVKDVCLELGIKNTKYAMFEALQKAEQTPDGETFDLKEHFAGLLEDDNSRGAFGVAPKVQTQPTPANTSPKSPGETPPPAPGGAPDGSNAFKMDAQSWRARKSALGL